MNAETLNTAASKGCDSVELAYIYFVRQALQITAKAASSAKVIQLE
jgi:hypothetical protein